MNVHYWAEGDRLPFLERTVTNADGSVPDLTGATVSYSMQNAETAVIPTLTGVASIVDADDGLLRFAPSALDVAITAPATTRPMVYGRYLARFVVTFASGEQMTVPNFDYIHVFISKKIA